MNNEIKRHFYKNKDYILDIENKCVKLLPDFFEKLKNKKLWGKWGFKKIGGSSIGDVLIVDKYKSQFVAFCRIAWIGIPILNRKYVDAGIAIEPIVIDLIKKVSKKEVETFDPVKYKYDYFANKDDVMGGIPDGYIDETKTILEIKTTGEKNLEKWKKYGVPVGYLRQAQLYSYLMGVTKYSIVATFLKEEDYINPDMYPIEKRITKNWNYTVDKSQVTDDIKFVKEWYQNHTKTGISPQYDETLDADLLEWLDCSNKDEWEILKNKWIDEGKLVI